MRICPKCQRAYNDSTLNFCLEDGAPLIAAQSFAAPQSQNFASANKSSSSKLLFYAAGAIAGLLVIGLISVFAIAAFFNQNQDAAASSQTPFVNANAPARSVNAANSNSANVNSIANANNRANANSNSNANAQTNQNAAALAAKLTNSNAANANAAQDDAAAPPVDKNLQKLLGTHGLTLQWIEGKPGKVSVSKYSDGVIYLRGEQISGDDYVIVSGKITDVDEQSFVLDGEVATRVSYINNGQPCSRTGKMTFKATGSRKYWRMQNMLNPCTKVETDYVDVYF